MKKLIFFIFLFLNIAMLAQELDSRVIDINNLKLHIVNDGTVGSDEPGGQTKFDGLPIMYSCGFFIAGIRGDTLWGNGNFNLVYNYLPGNVVKDNNAQDKFYIVKSADPAFGSSWKDWTGAVKQGAYFYDGNNNGIYDPVDLNNNGIWDENEDRPDLIGDYTAWCVVNDGNTRKRVLPLAETPMDIEIRQTIFAYSPETDTNLNNVIFARYVIENKNRDDEVLENAYFGIAVDPDIGDYNDDKMGCDSVDNFGYCYNEGDDEMYGINPPALLVDLLQGVQSSVPEETFIDNNGNNSFDEGIDTPLDSSIINLGPYLGHEIKEGAKSIDATSIVYLGRSHCIRPPHMIYQINNYLTGFTNCGEVYDPCTFYGGNYPELENCESINPKFVFSGDPVTGEGWLNSIHQDTYFIISSGPFRLEPGKPQTIIFAIIAGRGTDSLNSITVAKEIDDYVQRFFDNNFSKPLVGITGHETELPTNFTLYQNYPNPFNPTTTIKYSIPTSSPLPKGRTEVGFVTLKIYDVLGREIKTLVNKKQSPGTYTVEFNAASAAGGLPSGLYFYKLTAGKFSQTKKMLLLK